MGHVPTHSSHTALLLEQIPQVGFEAGGEGDTDKWRSMEVLRRFAVAAGHGTAACPALLPRHR